MKKILITILLCVGYFLSGNAQVVDGKKYHVETLDSDTTITFELSFVATHSSVKTGKVIKHALVMWRLDSLSRRDGDTYKIKLSPDQFKTLFTDQAKYYLVYDLKNDIVHVFEKSN